MMVAHMRSELLASASNNGYCSAGRKIRGSKKSEVNELRIGRRKRSLGGAGIDIKELREQMVRDEEAENIDNNNVNIFAQIFAEEDDQICLCNL